MKKSTNSLSHSSLRKNKILLVNKNLSISHLFFFSILSIFVLLLGIYSFTDFTRLTILFFEKVKPANIDVKFKNLKIRPLTSIQASSILINSYNKKLRFSGELNDPLLHLHIFDFLFFKKIKSEGRLSSLRVLSQFANSKISDLDFQVNIDLLEIDTANILDFFSYVGKIKFHIQNILLENITKIPFLGTLEPVSGEIFVDLNLYKDKIAIGEASFLFDIGTIHINGDIYKKANSIILDLIIFIELSDTFITKHKNIILLLKSQQYLFRKNQLEIRASGNINKIKWLFKKFK